MVIRFWGREIDYKTGATLAVLFISGLSIALGTVLSALNESELALSIPPSDILHSKAYINANGQEEVKIAYMTGEVPVDTAMDEDISLRTPVSKTRIVGETVDENGEPKQIRETVFFNAPQMYKSGDTWRQIEYATTTPKALAKSGAIGYIKKREYKEKILSFVLGIKPVFAQSTFYPNANVETTSVDGNVQYTAAVAWSTAVSAADGSSISDDAVTNSCAASISLYSIRIIQRGFTLFDTSSLPDGASVTAATLSYYITAVSDQTNGAQGTVNIITTTPASNTGLTTADYDQVGSTLQATAVDLTGLGTAAYYDFTLNATGRGNVSLTGVTKFGCRIGYDLNNIDNGTSFQLNSITFSAAEETGTAQDPKLVVTYTTDTTAPTPNPATFSSAPSNNAAGQLAMTATTGSDAGGSTPIEYSFTAGTGSCGANVGTGGTSSGWQTSTSYTDTGLQTNKCYSYTVQMRDSLGNTGTASGGSMAYTTAATPGSVAVSSVTGSTAVINNDENGNPTANPATTFAVYISATSPSDAAWNAKYVNASGNPSATAVWLTDAQLTNLTLNSLQGETTYTIASKARNGDSDETAYGSTVQFTTAIQESPNEVRLKDGVRFKDGVRLYYNSVTHILGVEKTAT